MLSCPSRRIPCIATLVRFRSADPTRRAHQRRAQPARRPVVNGSVVDESNGLTLVGNDRVIR